MGIDYYACNNCSEAFPDVVDYGHCSNCHETLCSDCRDEMGEKFGVLGEDHEDARSWGVNAPLKCDECNKATLNKEKFSTLMYALTKFAARDSFVDFLENWGLTDEDYAKIKEYLKENYDTNTYV